MEGANPTWVARQLGHANAQMLFKVYGKWIDGADKSRERDKLSKAFAASTTASADSITEPSRGVGKSAES